MRLSVVTTLYRSAPYLREFHRRASEAARRHAGDDYEIVFVNDGSPDEALDLALELREQDPHLRVVDLSRNFGHHQAMWIGLQQARGDFVFLLDCDLEEAPEWLADMERQRRDSDADVVFGVQETRRGGWFKRWTGTVSYKICNAFCDVKLPPNLMTARLLSRRYVDALLQHTEVTFTIAGLWARTGFNQVALPLPKQCKPTSTYGIVRRLRTLVNIITAFSDRPLVCVFWLGMILLALSTLVAGSLIVCTLFFTPLLSGWPSLMVSLWFLGGLIISCQGILGIYLARVYQEVKRRPIALIRHTYERKGEDHERLRLAR